MNSSRLLLATCLLTSVFLVGCDRNKPASAPDGETTSRPADGPAPPSGPSAASVEKLLDGLPKDKLPKPGAGGLIERNEAKKWLAKNVVGQMVEAPLRVADVELADAEGGKYNVELSILSDPETGETKHLADGVDVGSTRVGGVPCRVQVYGPRPAWSDLDGATAKQRRALKSQRVVLRGKVEEAEFHEGADDNQLLFIVTLTELTARVQKSEWVKVQIPEWPCSALFPEKPERTEMDARARTDGEASKSISYLVDTNGVRYLVHTSELTAEGRRATKLKDTDAKLKLMRGGVVGEFPGTKVLKELRIAPGGHPGIELTVQIPEGLTVRRFVRTRGFAGDHPSMILVAGNNLADLTSPDAERFLNSLTIHAAAARADKTPPVKDSGKEAADLFQTRSVWVSEAPQRTLTVLERKGETFRAKFVVSGGEREVSGTVKDGKVLWLAKDVRAPRGVGPGGDNEGTSEAPPRTDGL